MKRLALLALCIAAPAFAQHPLPPIPDSVFSTGGWVKVQRASPVECGVAPPVGMRWGGCYTASSRKLVVASDVSLVEAWRILLHEEVHLAARDLGLGYTGVVEEALADAVANRRLAEMLAH